MRQVPTEHYPYTIIGDGRVARHFCHYLTLLQIPYQQWSRRQDPTYNQLPAVLARCQRLLLLIRDDAIVDFIQDYLTDVDYLVHHFSGSVSIPGVIGAHPLMTFAEQLYEKNTYVEIPWIVDTPHHTLADILPGLPNPSYTIPAADKAYYHALCVLSGNFTSLLWQKATAEFAARWHIPANALHPYLKQITQNLCVNPQAALTGPLVRGDQKTLQRHRQVLAGDVYARVYDAFVSAYQETQSQTGENTHV